MLALAATLVAAPARADQDPVTRWLTHHAQGLPALDDATDGATVVGLGESVHGAHEEAALKVRALKRLVTREGFRSVAWEEDWTTGRAIDRFVTTGRGRLPGPGRADDRPVAVAGSGRDPSVGARVQRRPPR